MVIYCYQDDFGWGSLLNKAATKVGIEARMFSNAGQVVDNPDTFAFMHLIHFPFKKQFYDKSVATEISKKKSVKLIPTITECIMYDDKWAFYEKFPKWTPKTHLIVSYDDANAISQKTSYPFISKSREGAASSNVRLIQNQQQALIEAKDVFGNGMSQFGGEKQKGYLIWQEFCANNDNDWRVIIIAQKYGYVLKRYNRSEVPFASGSGRLAPVKVLDEESKKLLEYCKNFSLETGFSFVGMDIVYNKEKNPVILEITTGWDINGYKDCQIFKYKDENFLPTGMDGKDNLFDIVVKAIKKGEF